MNPVTHFEMPYDAADRVAKFYKTAFGWKMKNMGEKMGDYVLATTAESAPNGRPKKGGEINGGFFPKKPDWPAQHPSVVIAVANLAKSMAKVTAAGGQVLGDPMDIPGVGAYVSFVDTEGNRVGMLQPMMAAKAKKKPVAKKKVARKR
jgi:predicted enzyme related to lactoylglutathione lyase